MTPATATRLSLHERVLLRPGTIAGAVVFDPNTLIGKATFQQPVQVSVGVRDVFIDGVAMPRDGVHTGAKPGRKVGGPG